jgi:1,4-alpha-glucan branching enzyme
MVIYEMHVEGLGAGEPGPGTFQDAIAHLDHLVELGVNAIELLPTSEAESWTWGYGTSHYFATEYAGGGRDQLKHFVRACHQRGIAVLIDVVYNHYVADSERSEWQYDSGGHQTNVYYWYEGREGDWPSPDGGYLDNGSTGYTPNFRSEMVRKLFISSAAMLMTEFHIDGFRVDLTQAMHRDNVLHADNRVGCREANRFGAKFLREWVRTLRLLKPSVVLMAEDHTGWRAITQPQETGGIGFDAVWWADWYHNLIGDSQNSTENSRLIYVAGFGGNEPLAMARFGSVIAATPLRVIYHESHDQAGNAYYELPGGQRVYSARTIEVAVNGHLDDSSRPWADARCRVACGLTLLTPGVPMFFMGEEVGARQPYRYCDWIDYREDIIGLRRTTGARLFEFYREVIRLRRANDALNAPHVEVVHAHDGNRVIAFRRRLGQDEFLVVASLNNRAFADGYWLSHPSFEPAEWIEVLNSDAAAYGGGGVVNAGTRSSTAGAFNARLPANGVAVFQRI